MVVDVDSLDNKNNDRLGRPVNCVLLTPLINGLSSKSVDTFSNSGKVSNSSQFPQNQCVLYVGEHFALKTAQWVSLSHLIQDPSNSGFVTTVYLPSRGVDAMCLTPGGYRILGEPNAGGSSEISEVLSFEMMSRCFKARLTKVDF